MGAGDSKANFREALQALNDHDISAGDDEFWGSLWRCTTTALEVFEVIAPESVRRIRRDRSNNIAALFNRAVAKLCSVVESPYEHNGRHFEETLVCIRILTRVLPFLLEGYRNETTGEVDPFLEKLFWASSEDESEGTTVPLGCLLVNAVMQLLFLRGFTIDSAIPAAPTTASKGTANTRRKGTGAGGGGGSGGGSAGAGAGAGASSAHPHIPSEFTVANPAMCWETGLIAAGTAKIRYNHSYERNRIEVMRLLLCMLCEPLFQSSESFNPAASRFAQELTRRNVPFAAELFISLMNCALSFDPVGWGVPYGAALVSDAPTKQMEMCSQVLVALLDCGTSIVPLAPLQVPANEARKNGNDGGSSGGGGGETEAAAASTGKPSDGQAEKSPGDIKKSGPREEERICQLDSAGRTTAAAAHSSPAVPTATAAQQYNYYRDMLARTINDVRDFNFIFQGLNRMLNNVHESRNTYMPGATMQVSNYQELLVLFWKLIEENPLFTGYLLKSCDVTTLLVPICFLLLEYRKDVAKGGLIHINTFILLKLSGERNFGVSLNKEYKSKLPVDLPLFSGTHCDLLILTLHKLMVSGNEGLSSLYHCFLTVICNVSPYCKSLSLVASMKLVRLFELYTSSQFLYAAESNHVFIALLLEMFNNIIQYQYIGNAHLVYAIIRRKELFERLHQLSLPAAINAAQSQGGIILTDGAAAAAAAEGAGGRDGGGGRGGGSEHHDHDDVSAPLASAAGGGESRLSDAPIDGDLQKPAQVQQHQQPPPPSRQRPKFVPTQEWLNQVQSELPMNTIMRLIQYLVPQIDDMCAYNETVDEAMVVNFLRNTTMVGLLPVPHPIVIRKYQPNHHTALWFTAFMWGVIFVRNQELPIFDGQKIRLFTVTLT